MKQLISIIIVILLVIVGFSLFSGNIDNLFLSEEKENSLHDDDDDDDDGEGAQQLVDGSLIVKIAKETQQFAGIKTSLTENIKVQSEDNAFSSVIDIQELLDMRSNYRKTQAQRKIINTAFKNTSKLLEQLKVLHKEANNISARELQQANSKWEEERARVNAIDIELQNIRENMIQKWNTELTALMTVSSTYEDSRIKSMDDLNGLDIEQTIFEGSDALSIIGTIPAEERKLIRFPLRGLKDIRDDAAGKGVFGAD
ncbi:MAG: hypothetical protein ACPHLK_08845, partial [Gammaproteobacteria bacterium]